MKLVRSIDDVAPFRGGFVSIGNFDGVHRGHQRMLGELVAAARFQQAPSLAMTFDPHPIRLLRPSDAPPRLSTVARKAELVAACGVDALLVYPTTQAFLDLSAEAFFTEIVQGKLAARGLIKGPNFFFGRNREGNVETLRKLCDRAGLSLHVTEPVIVGGTMVSSSEIRARISQGDLDRAVELLGHPYQLEGIVVHGEQRGRAIGFPTANLSEIETLIPADGVYAGEVPLAGNSLPAAVHIGRNVTFDGTDSRVEVHVLDFSGDLYGQRLAVRLWKRIRTSQRFDNPEQLQEQIRRDVDVVRAWSQTDWHNTSLSPAPSQPEEP